MDALDKKVYDVFDKVYDGDWASFSLPRALLVRVLYSAQLGTPMYDEGQVGEETRLGWYLINDQLEGEPA